MTDLQSSVHSITELRPKMRLQGVVKETQLYGAVVDLGLEYDGLVHISQLTTERVNRVTDVVQPGDKVTVWVTQVNPEKGRIGLTMVEPPKMEWHELAEGQVCVGKVTRIEPYGAFVDIGAERPGLLHVREMSTSYVRHPSDVVKMDEEVTVRILKLDRQKKRIDLSMMGIQPQEEDLPEEEEVEAEEISRTPMELALRRAQQAERSRKRRQGKRTRPDLSEREDILTRTIQQHSKR